jgi:hypothetical protein
MTNLSGTWLGTYWENDRPTRFEMTLLQGGNILSGRVLDDGYLGEASLVGESSGRSIDFTKTYLTSASHSVCYTGTISEDGNKMQGRWIINFSYSGNWEAQRSDDNLSFENVTRQADKIPASIL